MIKKHKSNKVKSKQEKQSIKKYVCPFCYEDMQSKKLDDGYIICLCCGSIVKKQKMSLENIYAPGFMKVMNKQQQHHKGKKPYKNKNKHHNLIVMKNFTKKFKKR